MRLLVIGHPYALAYLQRKFVAIKQVDPGVRLRLLTPRAVPHTFRTYPQEIHPCLTAEEVSALRSVLWYSHMTYLLDPLVLAQHLRAFAPEVIHIEEEPQAFVTVETLWLRQRYAPQAAVTLFTWDNLLRRRAFPLQGLKACLRRFSLRRITAVVCGNSEAADRLSEEGCFEGPITVLPQQGLDPVEHATHPEPELRRALGLGASLCVGYAGRLIPEKGVRLLLQALGALQHLPWKLLLVGSGPLESEIRNHWMARYPGRIVHIPAVPHEHVPAYLRAMDIFVLASYRTPRWKEQFGLVLAQAMMVGRPSIVSNSGAIPEVAGPGALVFPEGDVAELRRALQALLTSAEQRARLGQRAREFALARYTLAGVAGRYRQVFELARQAHSARTLPLLTACRCATPERIRLQ
ncbi:MAG: glycosyltransferase family 4 protein [Firmicutes bacterium]|nr:glycosyltransferase family 4 protein [Bacillota bacterium]